MVSTYSLAVILGYVGRMANIIVYIPNDLREKFNILRDDSIGNSEERSPYERVSNSEWLPG
jgi:hypothetical protein